MGARLPVVLLCGQWRWALPWAMPLLLIGSQLLATHGWNSQEERENDDQKVMESYFPATVEYALHIFNLKSKDRNAYKLVRVRSSRREQVGNHIFLSHWSALVRSEGQGRGGGMEGGGLSERFCSLPEVRKI